MRTRDPDKVKRIKAALVKLILSEGIENASVAKIAREAGISPATIYIYYDSKEDMLAEVYREYARQSYSYMMQLVRPDMGGRDLIEALIRGYYAFSVEHEEIFSFVEQCTHCPSLSGNVREEECSAGVMDLLRSYQERGVVKHYSEENLNAVLFAPVRFLSMNRMSPPEENRNRLNELISMMQDLLLM